jgi:hypothetical protein
VLTAPLATRRILWLLVSATNTTPSARALAATPVGLLKRAAAAAPSRKPALPLPAKDATLPSWLTARMR